MSLGADESVAALAPVTVEDDEDIELVEDDTVLSSGDSNQECYCYVLRSSHTLTRVGENNFCEDKNIKSVIDIKVDSPWMRRYKM